VKPLFFLLTLPAVALAQQTGVIQTPDVALAYESYGSSAGSTGTATPVIAANGGPGLSHVYMIQNDMWTRLSKTRQVVFYDQRGTGKSVPLKPGASQTLDTQVADLEAVRAHVGFAKFNLVGDSYGGFLAMAYAAAHPEHIEKLVLSDSAAPGINKTVNVFAQVFPDRPTSREDAQTGLRNHFKLLFYSEEKRDAYLAGATDLGFNPDVAKAVRAGSQVDLTPQLAKFDFPTLVITGRFDMNVAPLTAWQIHQAIPGSQFVVFEKSGHLPSYEEPDKYLRVLEAFFTGR
jgi:proline iminopeptidase